MKQIILVLILFLIVSCKKETTLHISAKNSVTGVPYPNLKYYVVEYKSAMFEGKYKTILEGTLDNNGEVFLTEKLNKKRAYIVRVERPSNVCYQIPEEISYTYSFQDGENPKFPFEFAECAYLKLKIENVNCLGENDVMKLYQGNQVNTFNYTNAWTHNGCAIWSSTDYSDIPMGENYYKWEVTRNGITETFYDTIYLNAGEYKTYNIDY
jgi:hypothetical protein